MPHSLSIEGTHIGGVIPLLREGRISGPERCQSVYLYPCPLGEVVAAIKAKPNGFPVLAVGA
jgi:hypothetical protein